MPHRCHNRCHIDVHRITYIDPHRSHIDATHQWNIDPHRCHIGFQLYRCRHRYTSMPTSMPDRCTINPHRCHIDATSMPASMPASMPLRITTTSMPISLPHRCHIDPHIDATSMPHFSLQHRSPHRSYCQCHIDATSMPHRSSIDATSIHIDAIDPRRCDLDPHRCHIDDTSMIHWCHIDPHWYISMPASMLHYRCNIDPHQCHIDATSIRHRSTLTKRKMPQSMRHHRCRIDPYRCHHRCYIAATLMPVNRSIIDATSMPHRCLHLIRHRCHIDTLPHSPSFLAFPGPSCVLPSLSLFSFFVFVPFNFPLLFPFHFVLPHLSWVLSLSCFPFTTPLFHVISLPFSFILIPPSTTNIDVKHRCHIDASIECRIWRATSMPHRCHMDANIDPTSMPRRFQIDATSMPHRYGIDATSMPTSMPHIDATSIQRRCSHRCHIDATSDATSMTTLTWHRSTSMATSMPHRCHIDATSMPHRLFPIPFQFWHSWALLKAICFLLFIFFTFVPINCPLPFIFILSPLWGRLWTFFQSFYSFVSFNSTLPFSFSFWALLAPSLFLYFYFTFVPFNILLLFPFHIGHSIDPQRCSSMSSTMSRRCDIDVDRWCIDVDRCGIDVDRCGVFDAWHRCRASVWHRCGIYVASIWHRCGIDVIDVASMCEHQCGIFVAFGSGIDVVSMRYRCSSSHRWFNEASIWIDVASMWIDGGPRMERKKKRKIKWNKGIVKGKQDRRGPERAQKSPKWQGKGRIELKGTKVM